MHIYFHLNCKCAFAILVIENKNDVADIQDSDVTKNLNLNKENISPVTTQKNESISDEKSDILIESELKESKNIGDEEEDEIELDEWD